MLTLDDVVAVSLVTGTDMPGDRVVVNGTTGSGKSTLASALADANDAAYVELDALFWQPGWVSPSRDEFRAAVRDAVSVPRWVTAGNYRSHQQDISWPLADTVVFLDLPLHLVVRRVLKRSWQRWRSRELLWGTNYEPFWRHLTSWEDSLIAFAIRTHRRYRERFMDDMRNPRWRHINFIRLTSPVQVRAWLRRAEQSYAASTPHQAAAADGTRPGG